jgi:hypothetical protein
MKNILSIFTAVAISVAAFAHGGDLTLNFKTNINGNALQFNNEYNIGGANAQVNFLGYYISDIKVVKSDNSEVSISGIYLVKGNETLTLTDELDAGSYKAIKFNVGIADSLTNHGDPSLQPSGSPLALQTPSMHWSWNTGYIFFRLDGLVDTSVNNQHGATESLTYHLGRLSSVRTVNIQENFTIVGTHDNPGQYEADVVLNLENVFSDINLKTNRVTMTMNNPTLATEACDNLPDAFEFSLRNVTGINDKNIASGVKLYPNPATESIVVEITDVNNNSSVNLIDITGKQLSESVFENGKATFNISSLENGIYFIKQYNTSNAFRFVKQ